jgi:anti-sigma factor RsiW
MGDRKAREGMNERLDYLLSAAIDEELDAAEREELDRLLAMRPDASRRRAALESANALVQAVADRPELAADDDRIDRGLADVRARIAASNSTPIDELSERRRTRPSWFASLPLAAAAALVVYFVLPEGSIPPGLTPAVAPPAGEQRPLIDDPIALAVVFELDEDAESIDFIDTMSAEEFEIIEQLELLEYLAARDGEGRG